MQGGCVWYCNVVENRLLVPGGVDGSGAFSEELVVIISGTSEKHLC